MTAQHTPGPWTVYIHKDGGDWDYQIRTVAPSGLGKHVAAPNKYLREIEANSSLLAAAPDLLAACRDMLLDLEAMAVGADTTKWPSLFARIATAKAAIAKARGSIPQCRHGIDEDDACDRCDAAMHGQP